MAINKVAVIGGGQMGRGIAQVFAAAGKDVIIYDIKQEFVDGAKANLQKGLDKMVARGKMEQAAADAIMGRISYSIDPDYADIGDTDLVVEAAVENMNIKKAVFKKLDAAAKPECILSTNTSSLSITEVASAVARKDKVIGMHFFNRGHEADRDHPRRQHL